MARTVGFGHLPSPHGGRGMVVAVGTVASVVSGGSFAVQYTSAGSNVLRNVQAPIVTVADSIYGTAVTAEAVGSSNGYVTVTLWNNGTGVDALENAGTVNLNFVVFGGGGSI